MTDKSLLDARKSANKARLMRTEAYAEKIRREFAIAVNQILALNKTLPSLDEGVMFSFDGASKRMQEQMEFLLRKLHSVVVAAIENGVYLEWKHAEEESDKLIGSLFGKRVMSTPEFSAITAHNAVAMNAFMKRHENGTDLSSRIWKSVVQLREEMEVAMTVAIGEGESAAQMSRKVRQYLNDPDLMFRRFLYKKGEDADGNPVYGRKWKKRIKDEATGKYKFIDYDRDSYKTGTGVYKSSARNAMRVARTETNNAYRASDHERWMVLDFVLGIHVELSKEHPREDICDKLAGDYPAEFNLTGGWHPQCFCVITPILVSDDEMKKKAQAALRGEKYVPKGKRIRSCPEGFNKWVGENKDKIAEAKGTGREPYFLRDNARMVDEILHPTPKELTPLERAKLRHEARTDAEVADIKARAEQRQKKHAMLKKTASNVLNVAKDYGEIDTSKLQALYDAVDLTHIQAETRKLAKAVADMKKQEQALGTFIPNAHDLHKTYSIAELKEAHEEIAKVFDSWITKYSYASVDTAPLAHLKNKLEWEKDRASNYTNETLVKSALTEKINLVLQKIVWEELVNNANSYKSFKTKSPIFKNLLVKLDGAIKSGNEAELNRITKELEKTQNRLIAESIRRGGTKGALNKEFKGTADGKDISSSIDVENLPKTDDSRTYGMRYTNEVAKLQGFDAPAKLVSDEDFTKLKVLYGDVFYRTVDAATVDGTNYNHHDFAMLYVKKDVFQMNGRGLRAYGDGIYVASASWNGRTFNKLDKNRELDAYNSSRGYGTPGACTTMEITWLRKPNIIKQVELEKIWNKLSNSQKMKFGKHMNTYACALGYDAMVTTCDYMVVFNRSALAIRKF